MSTLNKTPFLDLIFLNWFCWQNRLIYSPSKLTEIRIQKTIMSESRLLVICYSAAFKGVTILVVAVLRWSPSITSVMVMVPATCYIWLFHCQLGIIPPSVTVADVGIYLYHIALIDLLFIIFRDLPFDSILSIIHRGFAKRAKIKLIE